MPTIELHHRFDAIAVDWYQFNDAGDCAEATPLLTCWTCEARVACTTTIRVRELGAMGATCLTKLVCGHTHAAVGPEDNTYSLPFPRVFGVVTL